MRSGNDVILYALSSGVAYLGILVKRVIQAAKRLLKAYNPKSRTVKRPQLILIPHQDHQLDIRAIHPHALDIIYTLADAGFKAYIVGGGIRDVLSGLKPKDFDIATDATPEEVRRLFRNSRIIGRRFRLIHIYFGREIIEVATFRAGHTEAHHESHAASSKEGMIVRDNVFGTIEEDALRRDFTINALYYDPATQNLLDYVGGYADLRTRTLRLIGSPTQRYREDPVRLLRAARFAAKGFQIEKETAKHMRSLAPLLANVSPARLFEEMRKLFLTGHALESLHLLSEYHLLQWLFQQPWDYLQKPEHHAQILTLLKQTCQDTDDRLAQHQRITSAFFIAAFLWYPFEQRLLAHHHDRKNFHLHEIAQIAKEILNKQRQQTTLPIRIATFTQDIWHMQFRLANIKPMKAAILLELRAFRASFDFLLLRAKIAQTLASNKRLTPALQVHYQKQADELKKLAHFWEKFQTAPVEQHAELLAEFPGQKIRKRKRFKKKKSIPQERQ